MDLKIPQPVKTLLATLNAAGFEAFVVGGCVRDTLLGRAPKDWDITTNALPEKILELFPESFYENAFGTVGVKVPRFLDTTPEERESDIIEVTTYRTESDYADKRRPNTVAFTASLEEDLARRDFTINAIAYGRRAAGGSFEMIDPFGGLTDLAGGLIRTVGNPEERLSEDALRLMRAIRLYAELRAPDAKGGGKPSWQIQPETMEAIRKLSENLSAVSFERIRDEFSKIILSPSPSEGVRVLSDSGLLRHVIPELEEGIGVTQNLHHVYTVWEHNLRALETCPSKKLSVRLAALLHDVGKPRTKKGDGYRSTFYNHDHVGARMTEKILTRLRYPAKIVRKATLLVDNHLFYYNVGEVTEASVRRLIKRVGLENMDDLMAVRIGDRLGSGVPKAKPYKLRHLEYMIEKVSRDPISTKMLAVKGNDLIEKLGLSAGPRIGAILDVLLAEVIEDSAKNTPDELLSRARTLQDMDLAELRALAKARIQSERSSQEEMIKKRHWVQ